MGSTRALSQTSTSIPSASISSWMRGGHEQQPVALAALGAGPRRLEVAPGVVERARPQLGDSDVDQRERAEDVRDDHHPIHAQAVDLPPDLFRSSWSIL